MPLAASSGTPGRDAELVDLATSSWLQEQLNAIQKRLDELKDSE